MNRGIIRSCHDVSDGGIACALAKSAFAGGLGVDVELAPAPSAGIFRDDFLLFSESQSRFIVSVREKDFGAFRAIFKPVPYGVLGKVSGDERFLVRGVQGKTVIDIGVDSLREAWQRPFKQHFKISGTH